jgi:S-adenosylmethionine hydrolase
MVRIALPQPRFTGGGIEGEILHVDRFGNLVTNIDRATFDRLSATNLVSIEVGSEEVREIVSTYSDVGPGELCALFGSTDRLEIARRDASASATLGLGRGERVRVSGSA